MSDSKHGKAFGLFWAFIIVVLPLYHRTSYGMSSRDYKDGFYLLACAISLAIFRKAYKSWAVGLFLFLGFFGISVVADNVAFFHLLGLSLSIAVMFQFATHWQHCRKIIATAFVIALILQCFWIMGHMMNYDISSLWGLNRRPVGCEKNCVFPIAGSLDNSMVTAAYIAPVVFFGLIQGPAFFAFCFPLAIFALLSLDSSMGFFGIAIGFAYLLTKKRSVAFGSIVASAVFVPLLSKIMPFLSDSSRYGAWADMISNVGVSWMGKGLGYFFHQGRTIADASLKFYHEHNEYLALYLSFGFAGVLIVSLFLIDVIKYHRKEPAAACAFFATLATSYGAFPLHISSSALTFVVACGALLSYDKISKQPL